MPFIYRLQKILDFRIRKKDEQLGVVQQAQQAVFICEDNIRRNNEEIAGVKDNMHHCDFRMMETYDKYLHHLWDKGEKLEEARVEAQNILNIEMQKLIQLEQAVKVLEKHKDKQKDLYLEEEKKAELNKYSELGVQRFFRNQQEKLTEEEQALLNQEEKDL